MKLINSNSHQLTHSCLRVTDDKPSVGGLLFFMSKNKMQDSPIIKGRSKKSKEIVGKKFGRLTVSRYLGRRLKSRLKTGKIIWASVVEAICKCGSIRKYDTWNLTSGQANSCGCVSDEVGSAKRVKHGQAREDKDTSVYLAWLAMKNRCYVATNKHYHNYGGRGISVCDRWLNSFENFFADMGNKPSEDYSLDRYPNMNGNYEPSNCRWATREQQANNTRRNAFYIINGEKITATQANRKYGISIYMLNKKYKRVDYDYTK